MEDTALSGRGEEKRERAERCESASSPRVRGLTSLWTWSRLRHMPGSLKGVILCRSDVWGLLEEIH